MADTQAPAPAEPFPPPSSGDQEINALEVCVLALLSLDSEARCRVLEYLEQRFSPRF